MSTETIRLIWNGEKGGRSYLGRIHRNWQLKNIYIYILFFTEYKIRFLKFFFSKQMIFRSVYYK